MEWKAAFQIPSQPGSLWNFETLTYEETIQLNSVHAGVDKSLTPLEQQILVISHTGLHLVLLIAWLCFLEGLLFLVS